MTIRSKQWHTKSSSSPKSRTWRRSTTLSFETEVAAAAAMDAKKGKTRKESTPIKVWVTPEEKAAIAAKSGRTFVERV
jgi:hypothetical protein